MLMTAGLGTRLRPFTELEPKPLLPVMGIPIAQFALDTLAAAGVRRVVANVHHRAERAETGLRALDPSGAELLISDETREILGSAGGIRHALPLLGEGPFFILNADVLCDVDLSALARRHALLRQRFGVTMTLTLFPKAPLPGKYAELVLDRTASLIAELRPPAQERPFYVGAGILEPEAVAHLPDLKPAEFVPDVLKPAIAAGKAGAFVTAGIWHDIGDPRLWAETHFALMRRLETGGIQACWKSRIESANKRVTTGVWASREFRGNAIEWLAPSYYNGWGVKVSPRQLGPRSVLYGIDTGEPKENLVSFGGLTASIG